MNDLFEFPETTPTPPPTAKRSMKRVRGALALVARSHIVKHQNDAGKTVKYVRLSDDEHQKAVRTAEILYGLRDTVPTLMAEDSGLWGHRNRSRQTKGDVIVGLHEKSKQRHPVVQGRIGRDYTVKQLNQMNDIIAEINALAGQDMLEPVAIPFET